EEYDLSLRLLNAGWTIRRFDDLHVMHLKTPAARVHSRTTRLDVRNNLALIARRFPAQWVWPFALDWMARYWRIAKSRGHRAAFVLGFLQGLIRACDLHKRAPVSNAAFEQFARIGQ